MPTRLAGSLRKHFEFVESTRAKLEASTPASPPGSRNADPLQTVIPLHFPTPIIEMVLPTGITMKPNTLFAPHRPPRSSDASAAGRSIFPFCPAWECTSLLVVQATQVLSAFQAETKHRVDALVENFAAMEREMLDLAVWLAEPPSSTFHQLFSPLSQFIASLERAHADCVLEVAAERRRQACSLS